MRRRMSTASVGLRMILIAFGNLLGRRVAESIRDRTQATRDERHARRVGRTFHGVRVARR